MTHPNEPLWITWECPHCDTENTDNRRETSRPLCGGCDEDFGWEDVLTEKEIQQMNYDLDGYVEWWDNNDE